MVFSMREFIRMKFALFFILLFFVSPAAVSAEKIKQVTVNDYLLQAKAEGKKANSLISESSPYLLQHAYNPVKWYAWGEEAFKKAKKENKPIFLSIGYSTCHWCHVMAHESFENKKIAALLNEHFISVKVDREQRPDIDAVYMLATELINGHSGWPMSVFLDHDLRPFHAATYYPPFSSEASLGLEDVLLKLHELWLQQPDKINEVATTVTARITALADDTNEGGVLADNINFLALQQIKTAFDEQYGGFSAAPKFPRPGIFAFLNLLALDNKKEVLQKNEIRDVQQMMEVTLDAMASGGLYDQLAGGFHRYSVDERWQVPHFEKMLYSQALMVLAYTDFYRVDPQDKYKQIVYETLNFVKQEMQSPQGGFYSALDADSERTDKPGEHAEGAYYLWHESELKKHLSKAEFEFVKEYFHIRENGNIDSDPQNEFIGLNILYVDEDYRNKTLSQQQVKQLVSVKRKLNKIRHQRFRPHLDDKVITAWNGMMLSAFAKASITFNNAAFLNEAIQTITYVKEHLYLPKIKKLLRQYRSPATGNNHQKAAANAGETRTGSVEATLEDYAWFINGLLAVYEASKDKQWLGWALELQDKQNELFLDEVSGAYFESVANDSSLLFRSKSIYDGALPSANAIALSNLRRFSKLPVKPAQKEILLSQANKLVSSFATAINQNPAAAAMLLAVEAEH